MREHNAVSNNSYLNMSLGGRAGAFTGKRHSDETKQKLRNKSKKYKHTLERKDKISKAVRERGGTPHSNKTKERLSELAKSRFADLEWKEKWYQSRHQSRAPQNTFHTPEGVFNSAATAAAHFNISKQSVYNRCQSGRTKWSKWYKI